MLVLGRKVGESVEIDGQIKIRVVKVKGNRIQLGIEAPDDVQILRSELNEWCSPTGDGDPVPDALDVHEYCAAPSSAERIPTAQA